MLKRAFISTVFAAMALGACAGDGVNPQNDDARLTGELTLTASMSQAVVTPDDPGLIVFLLRNGGPDTLTLPFGSTCQVRPYVTTSDDEIVIPGGGAWACGAMLTSLTLAPGGEKSVSLLVNACAGTDGRVLLAGNYKAYARIDTQASMLGANYSLRSDPIEFRVDCG